MTGVAMPAVDPLHAGTERFEGGLVEAAPGVHAWLQPNGLLGESDACLVAGDGASLLATREMVLGGELAEHGFADWLAPERALVSIRTIAAHRRGPAAPPGPRELVGAFLRMALLARDHA